MNTSLLAAVEAALKGDWDTAHQIAQDSSTQEAHWLHAVLHKIEGDEWNSRYWYRHTQQRYEDFDDVHAELHAIAKQLEAQSE
ncbi:hypothetical protein LG201_11620 [Methylobacillus gramineus]|uniref:hypothetical protein n=1 Tax=Methylobacillus gramineus TaxID=755169 RepID=UPI001CFFB6F0|nr:hypothetical protein [Methylobacillus gramineus]MCB5185851.1 hypothetical protein [Methylobacillus gramineus]